MRQIETYLFGGTPLLLLSCIIACSSGSATLEMTNASVADITGPNANINVSNDSTAAYCETSVAVVPSQYCVLHNCMPSENVVIGYNKVTAPPAQGWGVSTNLGTSYVAHQSDDTNPTYAWPTSITFPDNSTLSGYISDPTVVATGHLNQVAFTTIALTNANDTYVVLVLSTDGGHTFAKTLVVSDSYGSKVDQPIAAADTTTGDVYVSWRNNFTNTLVRRVHINGSGNFYPAPDPIQDISNNFAVDTSNYGNMAMAVQGGVRRSDGTYTNVYFAYPNRYGDVALDFNNISDCSQVSNIWDFSIDTIWYLTTASVSSTGGWTWGSSNQIYEDGNFPDCTMPYQIQSGNRNRPQIAYVGGATPRIAVLVSVSQTKMGDNDPSHTGTRAILRESSDGVNWDYNIPVCGQYTDYNVLVNGQLPSNEPYCMQFGASLAYFVGNSNSPIAWAWHDTRDGTDGLHVSMWGTSINAGPVYDNKNSARLTALGNGVPWVQGLSCNETAWGGYEGMAGDAAGGGFYAAWGDSRITFPTKYTQVFTENFLPP
ncbi:MAG TPA: hypothetical protein VK662_05345 [Acidothermaceae bacterium]|jgi:hypothetical protein|nr:hypothetical protein [Acidothermaceae bacterium]